MSINLGAHICRGRLVQQRLQGGAAERLHTTSTVVRGTERATEHVLQRHRMLIIHMQNAGFEL